MTIAQLYLRTMEAYSRAPNDSAAKSWHDVLGSYPIGEVERAVRMHQADTLPDSRDGRPRGAWPPSPADIKYLIETRRRADAASSKRPKCDNPECEGGWIRVHRGQTIGGGEINPKVGAMKRCTACVELWHQRQARGAA